MYIQQKFILHFVAPIKKTERGNIQDLQLLEPAKIDGFGDKIGTDQIFDVRIYNKDLISLPDMMKMRLGSKVSANIVISTKKVNLQDGREFYQPYLTLKRLELIDGGVYDVSA